MPRMRLAVEAKHLASMRKSKFTKYKKRYGSCRLVANFTLVQKSKS